MGRHLGQYHLPLGLWLRSMHPKWNHSIGQSWLSQPIISPYDTCTQGLVLEVEEVEVGEGA